VTTLNLETEVQKLNAMFLRTGLLKGEGGEGISFELDQLGSTLLLSVRKNGVKIGHESLSLRKAAEQWVTKIVEAQE
jgi:hypothetical protein